MIIRGRLGVSSAAVVARTSTTAPTPVPTPAPARRREAKRCCGEGRNQLKHQRRRRRARRRRHCARARCAALGPRDSRPGWGARLCLRLNQWRLRVEVEGEHREGLKLCREGPHHRHRSRRHRRPIARQPIAAAAATPTGSVAGVPGSRGAGPRRWNGGGRGGGRGPLPQRCAELGLHEGGFADGQAAAPQQLEPHAKRLEAQPLNMRARAVDVRSVGRNTNERQNEEEANVPRGRSVRTKKTHACMRECVIAYP